MIRLQPRTAMKLELDGVCENGALNNQHTKPPLKRPVLFCFIVRLFTYGPRFAGMLTRGSMLTRDRGSYLRAISHPGFYDPRRPSLSFFFIINQALFVFMCPKAHPQNQSPKIDFQTLACLLDFLLLSSNVSPNEYFCGQADVAHLDPLAVVALRSCVIVLG